MKKTLSRGFTLIELLVVIAIIAMLASIVLASLSSARSKARDAKRLSDLKQLETALELYNSDNNTYPASGTNTEVSEIVGLAPKYIPTLPNDPNKAAPYDYRYCSSATSYILLTYPEKATNWCRMTVGDNNECGWDTYPLCN